MMIMIEVIVIRMNYLFCLAIVKFLSVFFLLFLGLCENLSFDSEIGGLLSNVDELPGYK